MHLVRSVLLASALLLGASQLASAKDAECSTTQDGVYACEFTLLDDAGSFEISAEGKPTFTLWLDPEMPGEAQASAVYEEGGRSVTLPGTYVREEEDGACWYNEEVDFEICAR